MTESEVKDALLKLNGSTTVETELRTLNELIERMHRRNRRLKFWFIGVWAAWCMLVVMMFGGYQFFAKEAPPPAPPGAAENAPVANQDGGGNRLAGAAGVGAAALMFAGLLGLPIIGVILMILLVLSPRAINVKQLQTGLAGIDSQLRQLAAAQKLPGKSSTQ